MSRKQALKVIDSGRDFILPKGSLAYRSTTNSNEISSGKKYVSFRTDDIDTYYQMVSDLADPGSTTYVVDYTTKNDMKVAGKREQAKILQKMYGKNFRGEDNPYYKEVIDKGILSKPIQKMTNEELNIYTYYNPYWHNFDILKQPISNPDTKRYIEELKKKGYDAVVDMEAL